MALNRNSKLKEVWLHPIGRDALQSLMRQFGKPANWPFKKFGKNTPLIKLDALVGAGYADALVALMEAEQDFAPLQEADTGANWWKEAVIYQIYLPSFMDADHDGFGDFAGVMQRLPYLEKLGADVLWLSPVLNTGKVGARGVLDFEAPLPDFGDLDDFVALTSAAHARGMRIIMGVDIGATSDKHPWFTAALGKEDSEYNSYYYFSKGSAQTPPNNWGRGGTGWQWYPQLNAWGLRLLGRGRMDLNWDNPEVPRQIGKALTFWMSKGVDGFCFGAANLVAKSGFGNGQPAMVGPLGTVGYEWCAYAPQLHTHLKDIRKKIQSETPPLLLGEVSGTGTLLAKLLTRADGTELDMIFDASHLASRLKPKDQTEGADISLAGLKQYYLEWMEEYGAQRWMTLVLENPELPRMVSRVGASPVYRSILAKMLGTLLFTLRGTPILYQGEELGLPNIRFTCKEELRSAAALRAYKEAREYSSEKAALQAAVRTACDHARAPIPWNSGPKGGFTGAEPWMRMTDGIDYLSVAAQMEDSKSVLNFYRKLIALRKKHSALVHGGFKPVFAGNKNVFCYFRVLENEKWYIEMNLTEKEMRRPGRILPSQHLALSNYEGASKALRPYEANIYRCE
ncbi:hypothetical protein LJC61_08680 [Ruminococcaceae bacterium OttesenSCG-928-A16]|nr:hypothetical protein [Ruminococcaceae bacterium OttesenSCG-928-A16]